MCIINDSNGTTITNTNIFAAPDNTRSRQITIFSNTVKTTSDNNLIILPVPNPKTVRLINLSHYPDVFKDINEPFQSETDSVEKNVKLESYKITMCKSIDDLYNLNPVEFGIINSDIMDLLKKYYPYMGFIICKLSQGAFKYKPFAYTHEIIGKNQIFIPTRSPKSETKLFEGSFNCELSDSKRSNSSFETLSSVGSNDCTYSYNTDKKSGNCKIIWDKVFFKYDQLKTFNFGEITSMNKYNSNDQTSDLIFRIC